MAEVGVSKSDKVSLEIEASPLNPAAKNDDDRRIEDTASGEQPPNPPRRDCSLEKTEDHYARVQKRKGLGSFPKYHFIYKPEKPRTWMSCLKISIIVFNLFIWALGAAVTALGIWIKSDDEFWKIQDNLDVKQFGTAGWVLIFIGIIIMLVGFCGCYGAITSSICFLVIFSIVVCIVLIMEIVVIALVWATVSNKNVQEEIKLKAKKAMGEMMRDDRQRDFIELLQAKLKCCGIDGPNDYTLDIQKVPDSCKNEETGTNYEHGCYQTVMDYLKSKASVVGGVAVAVFLLQVGVLVITICLLCGLKNAASSLI